MKEFNNLDDILDFAIKAEQDAVEFYTKMSKKSTNAEMKDVFESFAREEMQHKALLLKVKEEGVFSMASESVQDLKISDFISPLKPSENMTYPEALVVAIQKEKSAYLLYSKLAERVLAVDLKNVFISLAIEESKHKEKFEIEYDEFVLREN